MTPERWARLKSVFDEALALHSHARGDFVWRACVGDSSLARSAIALLSYHGMPTSLLCGPAMALDDIPAIVAAELRTFAEGEIVAQRFRIERFLAEGGMGEVYAAEDLELNEMVALKTVRPALAAD